MKFLTKHNPIPFVKSDCEVMLLPQSVYAGETTCSDRNTLIVTAGDGAEGGIT